MIKNNRGFMLVEVIITSTIIVTAMIVLYSSFNKLYQKYNTKNNYYSIDGLYATKEMINYLLNINSDDYNFNTFLNDNFSKTSTLYLIKDGRCNSSEVPQIDSDFCSSLKDLYHIKNMILTEYDTCSLIFDDAHNEKFKCNLNSEKYLGVNNETFNETFKDYIDYVIDYYAMYNASIKEESETVADKYSYLILTELEEDEINYYSNIRMR